jgi:L-alanine-DL-glutamate epimerase-like enolase superfamily enzyme
LRTPFVTALRRVEAAVAVRLTITDDTGQAGVGEAPPTEAITGESMADIARTLETLLLPALAKPFENLDEALARLHGACDGRTSAKACCDIALHNLFARKAGQPLWRFLGAESPPAPRTAVTVSLDTPEAMVAQADDFTKRGLTILKVKVGGKDGRDAARIEAVRRAAPNARLLVDANQAWRESEALRLIEAVAPLGIELVEQPLPARDLAGMRRLTARSPVPILADESAFDLKGVRRVIETEAAHMVNVKLMKCGGLAKAAEILQWCEKEGVPCMMGSMVETPASIEAALQLAARYPETVRYAALDSPLLYGRIPADCRVAFHENELYLKERK